MRRRVLFFFTAFIFLASLIGGSVFSTYSMFTAEGPLTFQRNVYIPKGKSLKQIALQLKEEGVIESSAVFSLGVRASQEAGNLKSGEYIIPPYASAQMVMKILVNGQTVVRRVTIPEGLTSRQIVEFLNEIPTLSGEVSQIPKNGTLLPETYYYSFNDTRQSIIDRMRVAMERLLAEEWQNRDSGLPFSTPEEAVTMASIVEKETAVDYERSRIASVFKNRIEKKMRLQSDPTVIFAVTDGRLNLNRRLIYADLRVENPYNTYVVYGLPPHPICNPGAASIKAVLHPEKTDYLYFVADGSGAHVFAKDYKQHSKNVAAWRKVRRNKAELRRRQRARQKLESIPLPPQVPDSYEIKILEEEMDIPSSSEEAVLNSLVPEEGIKGEHEEKSSGKKEKKAFPREEETLVSAEKKSSSDKKESTSDKKPLPSENKGEKSTEDGSIPQSSSSKTKNKNKSSSEAAGSSSFVDAKKIPLPVAKPRLSQGETEENKSVVVP